MVVLFCEFCLLIISFINFVKSGSTCIESPTRVNEFSTTYHKPKYCSGELIFSDEFTNFDPRKWKSRHELFDLPNNNQITWNTNLLVGFQKYVDSRENSYTQDGVLFIRPTVITKYIQNWPKPYDVVNSAHLTSKDSISFKYGRLDIRAKLPTGDWLWPGLWLAPKDSRVYGEWPRSGEIDLMQSRGNLQLIQNGVNIGVNEMRTTLHFGPDVANDGWRNAHFKQTRPNLNTEFHNYTMIWAPDRFEFYLDGDLIGTVYPTHGGFWELGQFATKTKLVNPWLDQSIIAPFNSYFHINLNVAVGGVSRYFPDDAINSNYQKPWKDDHAHRHLALSSFLNAKHLWFSTWPYMKQNGEDCALQIDYVRLYAL